MINNTLGCFIETNRNFKNLTQLELAEKAGVARTTVQSVESGRVDNPKLETIVKMLNAIYETK
jgi:transcriptional regulator with XRE-family HTH domain